MTPYLLDTTPLAALLNNRPAAVALLGAWLAAGELAISVLVYGEVVESFLGRADFQRRHTALHALMALMEPYAPDFGTMQRYAGLRRQLRPPHGPGLIGDIDTIIAATALEHDLTLVTTDGDFTRVPSLRLMLLDRRTFQPVVR